MSKKKYFLEKLQQLQDEFLDCSAESDESSSWPVECLEEEGGEAEVILVESAAEEEEKEKKPKISRHVLDIFGDIEKENKVGPEVHEILIKKTTNILKNGLSKEERENLMKKYPPPMNSKFLDGGELNIELAAAIPVSAVSRDKRMKEKEVQMSAAITAILNALTSLINNSSDEENSSVLNTLSDTLKILTDLQHQSISLRRSNILPSIDKNLKQFIDEEILLDGFLFGKDLQDRVKKFQMAGRMGAKMKTPTPKKNFKGPLCQDFRNASRPYPSRGGLQRPQSQQYRSYKPPMSRNALYSRQTAANNVRPNK